MDKYKNILLDTNIISAILRHPTKECRNYLDRFILNKYITCISINSIFELRKTDNLYEELLNTFNMIPVQIVKPPYIVAKEEVLNRKKEQKVNPILLACDMFEGGTKLETFLTEFLKTKEAKRYEKDMNENNQNILKQWYEEETFRTNNIVANAIDADRFVKEKIKARIGNIKEILGDNTIELGKIDSSKFPTLQMILYSQYYRVYDDSFERNPRRSK